MRTSASSRAAPARGASGKPKATSPAASRTARIVQPVLEVQGRALDPSLRTVFSSRLGHRLDSIRIHTDRSAGDSARALGADAFTVGRHIAFAPGRFDPHTTAGQKLLAHELAHTVQQSSASEAPVGQLEIGAAGDSAERSADRAACQTVSPGNRPPIAQPRLTRQRIQRAEAGTYVSRHDDPSFIDAAFGFYRNWGHPNVRRVNTLQDVVADLAKGSGTIDTFRIVSHANPGGLILGFASQTSPTFIDRSVLGLRDPASFRKRVASMRLLSDAEIKRLVGILLADTTTQPLLAQLGAGSSAPALDSSLGLLLRALIEKKWIDTLQLTAGGAANIPDKAILDTFNSQRIGDFGKAVVAGHSTAPAQKAAKKALGSLPAEIGPALGRASYTFPTVTQPEADSLAGSFSSTTAGGGTQLSPEIGQAISEGSGQGPFLRDVDKVRGRISSSTHVEIRGCQIGLNPGWLDDFRTFLEGSGGKPSLSAPDLFQYYFPLNFETFTKHPTDDAKLDTAIADPDRGLERDFKLQTQVRRGDLIEAAIAESGADLVKRYGLSGRGIDLAALQRLNPEITSWSLVPDGTTVFLRARQVAAGTATSWADIAGRHFKDRSKGATVEGFNPQITATALKPADQIFLQSDADRKAFGMVQAAPSRADIKSAIRGGQAAVSIETTKAGSDQPRIHLDNAKRRDAISAWLAGQKFDPQGRTAAQLSRLFASDFGATARKLHMQFLSRSYPNIEDPIFPDDPRFKAHIIKRP